MTFLENSHQVNSNNDYTTQGIKARDQINAILSRCRLQDLNYGNTTFSFQAPFYNSSDSTNIACNSVSTSQTLEGSILSTTEYSNQENLINEINYDISDNPIVRTFNNA